MKNIYRVNTRPQALTENIVQGEKYRITLLTEALVRLEYSEEGVFEDRATQFAFFRDFPKTEYRLVRTEEGIEIDWQSDTAELYISVDTPNPTVDSHKLHYSERKDTNIFALIVFKTSEHENIPLKDNPESS